MAAIQLQDLSNDLRKYAKKRKIAVQNEVDAAVVRMVIRLTLETPVDTGKAISNWRVSIGSHFHYVPREPYKPWPRGSSSRDNPEGSPARRSNRRHTIAAARKALKRRHLRARKHRFGSVKLSNAVDYISALNEGHSWQNPELEWVERVITSELEELKNRIAAL